MQPTRRVPLRPVTLIALLDLTARAAVPGALLALAHEQSDAALLAAAAVNVLAVVRGIVSGRLIDETLRAGWRAFVAAARRHSVTALRTRSAEQSPAMFVEATHRTAMTLAQVLPRLLADALGLVLCALAVSWLLGPVWLLAGVAAVALAGPLLLWVQRRLRAHEQRSFDQLSELSLDVATLLQAPAELRAHGREQAFARVMLQRSGRMGAAMRRTHQLSSLLSLLPLGVALVVALLPLREGGLLSGQLRTVAEAGVLGAAAISFAISLVRSAEAWSRSQPQRALFARFLRARGRERAKPSGRSKKSERSKRATHRKEGGWAGALELHAIQLRYDGATQLTPGPTSYRWRDGQGLALLGPNGAGKSSLALALLGLLAPDGGHITLADEPLAGHHDALAPHVTYLPQSPFVEPSRSVGWHLQLVLGDAIEDDALQQALQKTGLWPLLERRAEQRDLQPLQLPVGELSGGEQQRMHLARAFVPRSDKTRRLVILDEPEAALDAAGRARLAELLQELSGQARVLLIAHDPTVVPPSFEQLTCSAQPAHSEDTSPPPSS